MSKYLHGKVAKNIILSHDPRWKDKHLLGIMQGLGCDVSVRQIREWRRSSNASPVATQHQVQALSVALNAIAKMRIIDEQSERIPKNDCQTN